MTPLFVHASDAHLSTLIWTGRPDIEGDSYRSFEQVVTIAIHNNVPLLLTGDNYHNKKPESEAVAVSYEQFDRMAAAKLPVYYVQGQHCMADPPWPSVHPWPIHAHKKAFEIGGYQLYGLDWQPIGVLQQELAQVPPGTTFMLTHQVWKEHMGGIGNPEGSVSEVPHALFLLTGDLHKTQVTEWPNAQGQKMAVVSPGSTHMRAIDQPPISHCMLFALKDDGQISITPVPLQTRPYYETRITNEGELLAFCQQAATKLPAQVAPEQKLLLRVAYAMEIPEVSTRIRQAVGNRAHLFEDPYSAQTTVNLTAATTMDQAQRTSVESAIDRIAESPDLALAAKQLWTATSLSDALTSMFESFGKVPAQDAV